MVVRHNLGPDAAPWANDIEQEIRDLRRNVRFLSGARRITDTAVRSTSVQAGELTQSVFSAAGAVEGTSPVADGEGGWSWATQQGGGGGGDSLHVVAVHVDPAEAVDGVLLVPVAGLGNAVPIVAPATAIDAARLSTAGAWFGRTTGALEVEIGDLALPVDVTVTYASSQAQTAVTIPFSGWTFPPASQPTQDVAVPGLGPLVAIVSPASLFDAQRWAQAGLFFSVPSPGVLRVTASSDIVTDVDIVLTVLGV